MAIQWEKGRMKVCDVCRETSGKMFTLNISMLNREGFITSSKDEIHLCSDHFNSLNKHLASLRNK